MKRFGAATEPVAVSLTDCAEQPNPAALALVSALAQPLAKPGTTSAARAGEEPKLTLLNPELLLRVQRISRAISGTRDRSRLRLSPARAQHQPASQW